MKRRITLSIALVLSIVLVSLMSSDSTAKAQRTGKYSTETGMIHLGPNEFLRVMVAPAAGAGREEITYTITLTEFAQTTCEGGVCMHTIVLETTTGPVKLGPGQGASHDITGRPGSSAVRTFFLLDTTDVQVNAFSIDRSTGQALQYYPLPNPVRLIDTRSS